ncbi:hypothetical protein [[Mycoplasma] gypis]|uniref:Lipoprotein n=1 Tax=[Mycoplasma] gypis TaxID=92404 RepID=A0ABZ2RQG8_9BACT|nr:hypothetical protein [[Mycoplasma] gypis]MBN0919630.1 hypothetical protein [[Mycoplasma] gypis]
MFFGRILREERLKKLLPAVLVSTPLVAFSCVTTKIIDLTDDKIPTHSQMFKIDKYADFINPYQANFRNIQTRLITDTEELEYYFTDIFWYYLKDPEKWMKEFNNLNKFDADFLKKYDILIDFANKRYPNYMKDITGIYIKDDIVYGYFDTISIFSYKFDTTDIKEYDDKRQFVYLIVPKLKSTCSNHKIILLDGTGTKDTEMYRSDLFATAKWLKSHTPKETIKFRDNDYKDNPIKTINYF